MTKRKIIIQLGNKRKEFEIISKNKKENGRFSIWKFRTVLFYVVLA